MKREGPRGDDSVVGVVKNTPGDLSARLGRVILVEDRQIITARIEQTHTKGARLSAACQPAGITVRTLQRWKSKDGLQRRDRRPHAVRSTPAHGLSAQERERLPRVTNEPRFAELPPARIVPMLADEGVYLGNESSISRVLRVHRQTHHRGRAKTPQSTRPPTTHVTTAPGTLWNWDVTFLSGTVIGIWMFLHVILDVYSRKIVGWEARECDSSDDAVDLVRRTALAEGLYALHEKPVLHGDNGATVKATTVPAMLHWLGTKPSYSQSRVSDNNAFIESFFRATKCRLQFPSKGFLDLDDARCWVSNFVAWYYNNHKHSGIRYVSPAQRHTGEDRAILSRRARTVYRSACGQSAPPSTAHAQLTAHRGHHAQSRARLNHQQRSRGQQKKAERCVRDATSKLTRTGTFRCTLRGVSD